MNGSEPSARNARTDDGIESKKLTRRAFVAGAATTGAAAAATGSVSAASSTSWNTGRSGINFSSALVPNAYIAESGVTRAKHRLKWGKSLDSFRFYEDDNGTKTSLGGYVPTTASTPEHSTDNVVTVRADKFDFPDAHVFPRGEYYDEDGDGSADEPRSALDATHWTTTNSTNGTISVTDADLDVTKALKISSSTVPSGETVKATFSLNDPITSDAAKRLLAGIANVTVLESGVVAEIVAIDDDGDEKSVKFDPAGDATKIGTVGTATGNGYTWQPRLADLSTTAAGDGTFDSISSIEVRISDADAEIVLTALDVERKSEWAFGSYIKNEGTDDEKRVTRYTPGPGSFTLTDFSDLGDSIGASDALVHDVEHPFRYTVKDGDENYEWRITKAGDYASYKYRLETRTRIEVPQAIDLTHSGSLPLKEYMEVPGGRYADVWTASGTSGTDYEDIGDSSKTSHTGKYDSQNTVVSILSSTTAGTQYVLAEDVFVADDSEQKAVKADQSGGGGGAPPGQKKNSGLIAAILALFGGGGIAALISKVSG